MLSFISNYSLGSQLSDDVNHVYVSYMVELLSLPKDPQLPLKMAVLYDRGEGEEEVNDKYITMLYSVSVPHCQATQRDSSSL